MAYHSKKTEHAGPKKGRGAYHGRKKDAKKESSKQRRFDDGKYLDFLIDKASKSWDGIHDADEWAREIRGRFQES